MMGQAQRPNISLNNFEPKINTTDKLYSPSHYRYLQQVNSQNESQGVVPAPGKKQTTGQAGSAGGLAAAEYQKQQTH